MNKLKKQSRDQIQMLCLDDFVSKDSFARVIDAFVDAADLKELGFKHYTNTQGRPSYPTDVMVKLFLYGYMNGIRTTRKLENACQVNMELKWLLNGLSPRYRTIGNFRIDNAEAFNKLFLKTIDLAMKHKLIGGKTLAFDSFPIRASNSRKNNYNKKKLGFLRDHAQSQLDHYLDELVDNQDLNEEQKDEARDKIRHYEDKVDDYDRIQKKLDKEGLTQISGTDPDARVMSTNDRSNIVGYRTQCGADAEHKIVCAVDISNNNDHHSTATIAIQAKQNIKATKFDGLYDKGYHSGPKMAELHEQNITPFISVPKYKDHGVFPHTAFKYNKRYDTYTCPAGQTLSTNGVWRNRGTRKVKNYQNSKACRNCHLKQQCTSRKAGRLIARYQHYEHVEANRKRITKRPEYYKLRSHTIEHIFGTIKRHWKLDHTLLRTKEKVKIEYDIAFTCYNLMRIKAILAQNPLNNLKYILWYIIKGQVRILTNFYQSYLLIRPLNQNNKYYSGNISCCPI